MDDDMPTGIWRSHRYADPERVVLPFARRMTPVELPRPTELTRCTWDEVWMRVADSVACRSRCVRAQYGSVIVDVDNRIIATGYNGPPADLPTLTEFCDGFCERAQQGPGDAPLSYDTCATIHSEANALMFCSRDAREGGTLFVNGCPCLSCAKLIANSGLARVVYRPEPDKGYRDPRRTITLLRSCKLEVVAWLG